VTAVMRDDFTQHFQLAVKFASQAECGQIEDFLQLLKQTKNTTAQIKKILRRAFFMVEFK
jgi:hypothetical protein